MTWPIVLSAGIAAWLAWAAAAHALLRISPRKGDAWAGLAVAAIRVYVRLVQRLRVEGREHAPRGRDVGPLVVVANHTSGVDPLLIQSALDFEVRWMMARDMQHEALAWVWAFTAVIPVTRVEAADSEGQPQRGSDAAAARTAIKHLKAGGVVGVFPEGRIAPEGRVCPFLPGVGLLVSRTSARVLQAVVEGTARTDAIWTSLLTPGRARVRFLPMRDYEGMAAAEIAKDLEARLVAETGWRREGRDRHVAL